MASQISPTIGCLALRIAFCQTELPFRLIMQLGACMAPVFPPSWLSAETHLGPGPWDRSPSSRVPLIQSQASRTAGDSERAVGEHGPETERPGRPEPYYRDELWGKLMLVREGEELHGSLGCLYLEVIYKGGGPHTQPWHLSLHPKFISPHDHTIRYAVSLLISSLAFSP